MPGSPAASTCYINNLSHCSQAASQGETGTDALQVARILLKLGLANGVCEGGSLVISCPQQFETPPGLQIDQPPLLIPEVSVSVPEDLWWQIKSC